MHGKLISPRAQLVDELVREELDSVESRLDTDGKASKRVLQAKNAVLPALRGKEPLCNS